MKNRVDRAARRQIANGPGLDYFLSGPGRPAHEKKTGPAVKKMARATR